MHSRLLSLSLLFVFLYLSGCREDDETVTNGGSVAISGYVQKGPFINGTSLIASELNDSFAATGKAFTTQISDNEGTFVIKAAQLDHSYLQLTASGFYYNEVRGEKSTAQLTLFALADVAGASTTINVNVLSHLEKDRTLYLVEQEKDFAEAKRQAQQEILAAFGIERTNMASSEQLNIFQEGDDHAILLAISSILQGNNTVAELSELLATMTNDLREDGTIDNEQFLATLRKNAMGLDLPAIRQHLLTRYNELKIEATIPNFEQYVDSDGDGILNKDEDDVPDDFAFEPQVDVAINGLSTSNEITIAGLKEGGTTEATVSNGFLLVNDRRVEDSVASVRNGDKVQLQLSSSAQYADTTTATLTIGPFVEYFRVVTDDYIPDSFAFKAEDESAVETYYTSNTITLSGLPHPTTAYVTGGVLVKNGEEVKTDSVTVVEGDQLALKMISSSDYSAAVESQLTITGVRVPFQVTTDDYTPADFQFTSVEDATLDSVYTSETITLSDLPHPTPISLDSGTLWVNGQQIDNELVMVMTGDQIMVQLISNDDFDEETIASLRIGAVEKTFQINTPPNVWQRKTEFPAPYRSEIAGFVIGDKIYIGPGDGGIGFYEYDLATHQWTQKADVPSIQYNGYEYGMGHGGSGFVINDKGYLFGTDACLGQGFFQYDPLLDTWSRKATLPIEHAGCGFASFAIGNYGYLAGGDTLWKYDPSTDEWTPLAGLSSPRGGAIGFSANGKGYVALGRRRVDNETSYFQDFWKYDPSSDTWKQLSDYPGVPSEHTVGFVIGNYAYVGSSVDAYDPKTGGESIWTGNHKDTSFWRYAFQTNTWEKIDIGSFYFLNMFSASNSEKGYYLGMLMDEGYWERAFMYEFTLPQKQVYFSKP